MAYGISVYNASDTLIISQDYTNYHVVSSGSIANTGAWPAVGTGELLYLRAGTAGATISGVSTYDGVTFNSYATVSSGVIQYVIVKRAPGTSSSTYGLKIYQSNGTTIAFDSTRAACKIVSSRLRTPLSSGSLETWSITQSQPFVVPTGRKRYISGEFIRNAATLNFDGAFTYYHNYLTWTSDMQETFGYSGPTGADWLGTLIILTIDI